MCLPSTCGTGTLSGRPIGSVPCLLDRVDNLLLVRSWLWQRADSVGLDGGGPRLSGISSGHGRALTSVVAEVEQFARSLRQR